MPTMSCRSNTLLLVLCLSFSACLPVERGLPTEIDGCPMYGCRPSGSFSFVQEVPRGNVTIGWTTGNFQGPVPDFGGCAGNGASLVCQSNGSGPNYTGYMVLDLGSGRVQWRDPVLRFPTLPLVGTDGSFWGTDGGNLMLYSADGRPLLPEMHLDPNMRPLLGMQFVDVGYGAVLLVSQQTGELITTFTDGLPLANMFLNDTVQGVSGIFLPVAPAVTSKNRIYVLTEFAPDEKQRDVSVLGLQRLYAIDTSASVAERMKIVWHANFETEAPTSGKRSTSLRFRSDSFARRLTSKLRDPSVLKPSILLHAAEETIYVALPPPMLPGSRSPGGDRLFAIKDTGREGSMVFKAQLSAQNMLMYDGSADRNPSNAVPQLWVSAPDGRLLAIDMNSGVVAHILDMPAILKTNFTITSKITTARGRDVDEDFLLFGINVPQPTAAFKRLLSSHGVDVTRETPANYVIGVDTPENEQSMPLAWILPTPEDTVVVGQIIGIKGDGSSVPDQLIVYSQIEQKFAKVFSIIAQK